VNKDVFFFLCFKFFIFEFFFYYDMEKSDVLIVRERILFCRDNIIGSFYVISTKLNWTLRRLRRRRIEYQ